MHEKRKRLSAHLNVVEERASEAEQVNAGLESTINELRLARQRHTMHNNACAAKEKTMAFDMHGFAAGAHAALDEKERLAGRLRRLRHEYKQEVAGTDQELEVIHHTLNELQERHAELIDAAEKDDEFIRRQECRAMRKRRDTQERFSVRMDYLHNQLATLREQFAQLGHLAGITCGFDPERPRSNNILIAAVAEKEAANESQLSYLDELRRSEEDLVVAIAAMEAEESSIQDAFKAAQLADNAKLKQGMYFASRQEQLDMRVAKNEEFLLSLHKALAMMIDRLMASYDPGTVPMPSESARLALDRGEICSMSQAIRGSSAAALDCFQEMGTLPRSASIDEVEFDLMRLDHFLRAVQDLCIIL
mmetsp:Transcript_10862/g.28552  ORF Transcript_10862/g.28552 Transcript_10862/m.28552 type:complete len:363 (-) Transcript_10862:573-1661(-)